jgi:hypothetical protein
MTDRPVTIARALLSVSDKTGILDFARALAQAGVELLSTGGTWRLLADHGVPVQEVADYTGFPEMMDGRVKTLHPKIHGGILARRGTDDAVMAAHGIPPIDLVVVNLYPFEATVAAPDCDLATAIENIDIGGPTLLRAAAKNHRDVAVVVNSADYPGLLAELQASGGALSRATRFDLAVKAFEHTAAYDGAIANYLGARLGTPTAAFPRTWNRQFHKAQELRYGENPHQQAAFYRESTPAPGSCRAGSCPTTTSPTAMPRSNACASSTDRPVSSSSTPTPAAWPWPTIWRWPTPRPSPPIPNRPLAASSRLMAASTPQRSRPFWTVSLSRWSSRPSSRPMRSRRRPQNRMSACLRAGPGRADRQAAGIASGSPAGC